METSSPLHHPTTLPHHRLIGLCSGLPSSTTTGFANVAFFMTPRLMMTSQQWTGQTDFIETYFQVLVKFWNYCLSNVNSQGIWVTTNFLADINVGVHCPTSQVFRSISLYIVFISDYLQCSSGIVTPWIIERLSFSARMAAAIGQTQQVVCLDTCLAAYFILGSRKSGWPRLS